MRFGRGGATWGLGDAAPTVAVSPVVALPVDGEVNGSPVFTEISVGGPVVVGGVTVWPRSSASNCCAIHPFSLSDPINEIKNAQIAFRHS